MEHISNFSNIEEHKTETIKASFLENGDTIIIGGFEFEVIDADHQYESGRIKIKNAKGVVSQIDSFFEVEKVIKEDVEEDQYKSAS